MWWKFYLLEFVIYVPAAFFSFIGNYFNQIHFSNFQNGILGSIPAVILLISNPFWMRFSDRRIKNTTLLFLSLSSALMLWGVFSFRTFSLVFLAMLFLSFMSSSIVPVAESISLVYSKKKIFSFGKARMMGSIAYALAMMWFGYIKSDFLFFLIGSTSFVIISVISLLIPKTKGFNITGKAHHSYRNIPAAFYRMLMLELMVIPSGAFGSYFFPILVKERGEPLFFAGIAMGIPALSEIPFLLFADKIVERLGIKRMLILASFLFGIRWLLTSIFTNPVIVISIQGLEFFNWIAIYYAILYYTNYHVNSKYRADAQALFWMTTSGFSMILGLALGGWLANTLGVVNAYACFGALSIVGGALYWLMEHLISVKKSGIYI